jgi:hypothetical protein
MFLPSTTTLLSKSEPAKHSCSSRNGARDAPSREQHQQQKGFGRCPALRIFLVPYMQPQLGRGSAHRLSCPQKSRIVWEITRGPACWPGDGGVVLLWRGCGCLGFLDRVGTSTKNRLVYVSSVNHHEILLPVWRA